MSSRHGCGRIGTEPAQTQRAQARRIGTERWRVACPTPGWGLRSAGRDPARSARTISAVLSRSVQTVSTGDPARLVGLVPRNRNVRVAVLGSSVQRAAASGHSSTRSSPLRRRFVVVGLVSLSLALLTVSFRSTALDPVEGFARVGAAAVRDRREPRRAPVPRRRELDARALRREGRERAARGARTRALRRENADADRRRAGERLPPQAAALRPGRRASRRTTTRSARRVLTSPSTLDQSVTISAGSNQGIALEDVVVTEPGPRRHGVEGVRDRVARDADHRSDERRPRGRREEPRRGRDPRPRQRGDLARPRPGRQGQERRRRRHDHHRGLAVGQQARRRSSRGTSRSASSRASARATPTSTRTSRCSRSSTSPRSSRCSC